MTKECQTHGAKQGDDLPCVWCHSGGRYLRVPALLDDGVIDGASASVAVAYKTYTIGRARHPDGREWRWWEAVT